MRIPRCAKDRGSLRDRPKTEDRRRKTEDRLPLFSLGINSGPSVTSETSNRSDPTGQKPEGCYTRSAFTYAILNSVRKTSWLFLLLLPLLALKAFQAPLTVLAGPHPQATIVKSIFIQSPREGQALQGVEIIDGKIRGEGFLRGTIHFSYHESQAQERTWFFIADIEEEIQDSSQTAFQVEWDTTQITDGDYDLRVVAEYSGGAAIFELVPNLRVRNHSPVETQTPSSSAEGEGDEPPLPPSATPEPERTPTPLPPNPAEVRSIDLQRVLLVSGIAVAGFFFVGIMYWYLTRRAR